MSEIHAAVIEGYLKILKLPGIRAEYQAASRQARADQWQFESYLEHLLERELRMREEHMVERRLREALFPERKTLDQIDWSAMKGVSPQQIAELATCGYLEQAHDLIIAGPIGTGKTHLAIGLGVEAARRRKRVLFTKAADLVRTLLEARDDRLLGRLQLKMRSVHLLIIDELGFVPFDRTGGELLFNLIADRYERRSTLVTTNLAFSEWVQVFGDEKLTTALLDRLSHHAQVLTTKGRSYRTKRTTDGQSNPERETP